MAHDVLVIDDELSLARNIKEYIEVDGLEACVCEDGESGLAAFAAAACGVVVLDLRLPGMDGFAVLKQLRAQAPDVKVIVISAHGNTETGSAALAAGAYDYFSKPLAPRELRRVIAKAQAEVRLAWPTES